MTSFRTGPRAWLGGVGVLLLAGAVFAATVQRLDVAGLTHLSSHVVTGHVVFSAPAWTADGGAVVTLHELAVAGTWKGTLTADHITVRTPGGRMGDYTMDMPGAPELLAGDTVLLFLEQNPDATFGVVSLAQGSFRVGTAPDGSFVVTRDPGAAHLVAVDKDGTGKLAGLTATLPEMRGLVDAALAAERAGLPDGPALDAVPLHDVAEGGGK
jgi:hypothetical protein